MGLEVRPTNLTDRFSFCNTALETELHDLPEEISLSGMRELKMLSNFIAETGRLHSPVPNVPRGVVRDIEFGGYLLPAGTYINLALGATHLLPHVFANPETFDPDRFAPPREEDRRTPYSLVTFGGGSRICIGVNFANLELKVLAAHVLRNYTLAPLAAPVSVTARMTSLANPRSIRMRVASRIS